MDIAMGTKQPQPAPKDRRKPDPPLAPPPKRFQAAERFHPGVYIVDEMKARGWSMDTLIERSGITRQAMEELIAGSRPITPIMAYALGNAFDINKQVWLNLQGAYDTE